MWIYSTERFQPLSRLQRERMTPAPGPGAYMRRAGKVASTSTQEQGPPDPAKSWWIHKGKGRVSDTSRGTGLPRIPAHLGEESVELIGTHSLNTTMLCPGTLISRGKHVVFRAPQKSTFPYERVLRFRCSRASFLPYNVLLVKWVTDLPPGMDAHCGVEFK